MSDLEDIARNLFERCRAGAAEEPELIHGARRKLSRGLALQLESRGEWYTLTLSRSASSLSQREIDICRAAFQTPGGARQVKGKCYQPDGSIVHFVRICWSTRRQLNFFTNHKVNGGK